MPFTIPYQLCHKKTKNDYEDHTIIEITIIMTKSIVLIIMTIIMITTGRRKRIIMNNTI